MMKKNTKEKLLKRRWYIQGVKAAPALIHAADASGIKYLPKNLGFGYTDFLYFFKKDYLELHYDRDNLHFLAEKVISRYSKDSRYIHRLVKISEQNKKPFLRYLRNKIIGNGEYFSKLSNQELVKEYQRMAQLFYKALAIPHLIEPLALTTDVKLKDLILKELDKKGLIKSFSKYFAALTQTVSKFYLNEYNRDLKKMVSLICKTPRFKKVFKNKKIGQIKRIFAEEPKLNKLAKQHLIDYFWVKTDWWSGSNYTLADLIQVLQRVIKGEDNLDVSSKKSFKRNLAIKNSLIRKLKLSKEVVKLIRLIDIVTKWQDDRKKDLLIGIWGLDKFIIEISKRFKINHGELRYLLPEETTLSMLRRRSLKKQLALRRNYSVYLFYKNEKDILVGARAKEFVKRLKGKKEDFVEELSGLIASSGKTSGIAKICLTTEKAKMLEKGEVLVTSMTRPEFVPAMKKAAAVVTDEGGLTCHAAIISRELKIPCIIGTKVATKVLKDGDLVEVNANHGVVMVLKRAK